MKLLHTSDWHLSQNFMSKSREDEHHAFLSWLLTTIQTQNIELLIVAGDIFDTGTPANYALEMYYNFLTSLSNSTCKNIIIIAGNHDSVSTLKAPKQLLKALNVHVIASADEDEDEIIEIYDNEKLQAIVCAVPFLRDYVIRKSLSGEGLHEKESSLTLGIKKHYDAVYEKALLRKKDANIPIIATGHLTTLGSKVSDSEREIYIGGTLSIEGDFFDKFDYVALGHLHNNQEVKKAHICYSGSPIPLSFSEAKSQKKVNCVEFSKDDRTIYTLDIPTFRELKVLKGDEKSVISELEKISDTRTWIEVHLHDDNPYNANQNIRSKAKELELTLLAVKIDRSEKALHVEEVKVLSLDELTPLNVFEQRLLQENIEDEALKKALLQSFKIIEKELL